MTWIILAYCCVFLEIACGRTSQHRKATVINVVLCEVIQRIHNWCGIFLILWLSEPQQCLKHLPLMTVHEVICIDLAEHWYSKKKRTSERWSEQNMLVHILNSHPEFCHYTFLQFQWEISIKTAYSLTVGMPNVQCGCSPVLCLCLQ